MKTIESSKSSDNPSTIKTNKGWLAGAFGKLARPLASVALASSMAAVPVSANTANTAGVQAAQHSTLAQEQRRSNDIQAVESKAVYGDNWSGYMAVSDLRNPKPLVTGVSGTWQIPEVTGACNIANPVRSLYDTMMWVGIGGTPNDPSLIQIGTDNVFKDGQMDYFAWYELLPDNPIRIDLEVRPGDTITASIRLVDSQKNLWELYIKNLTTGKAADPITLSYKSSRLTAEWIAEGPTGKYDGYPFQVMPIGYPRMHFVYSGPTAGNFATIGNTTGPINRFPNVPIAISASGDKLISSGPIITNGPSGTHMQQFSAVRIQLPLISPSRLGADGGSFDLDLQNCPY